jgi:hypothetical protein
MIEEVETKMNEFMKMTRTSMNDANFTSFKESLYGLAFSQNEILKAVTSEISGMKEQLGSPKNGITKQSWNEVSVLLRDLVSQVKVLRKQHNSLNEEVKVWHKEDSQTNLSRASRSTESRRLQMTI